jgi:hypothetical protein
MSSRNTTYSLPKCIWPVAGTPAVEHVIDTLGVDRAILVLGDRHELVTDFLTAYGIIDRFDIVINRHYAHGSVTSVLAALESGLLSDEESVMVSTCDSWHTDGIMIPALPQPTVYVGTKHNNAAYCNFVGADTVTAVINKSASDVALSWSGLIHFPSVHTLRQSLGATTVGDFANVLQFIGYNIQKSCLVDIGSDETYHTATEHEFLKPDQLTWIGSRRIVKWWADSSMADTMVQRAEMMSAVATPTYQRSGEFLFYDKISGESGYIPFMKNLSLFDTALRNLVELNTPTRQPAHSIYMYVHRPIDRLSAYYEKLDSVGINVEFKITPDDIISLVRSTGLISSSVTTSACHGDFTLDNIIVGDDGTLHYIDHRANFGQSLYGDVYYDLGKLYAYLIVNFTDMKNGNTSLTSGTDIRQLKARYIRFVRSHHYDMRKIKLSAMCHLLSMAGLHNETHATMCYLAAYALFRSLNK